MNHDRPEGGVVSWWAAFCAALQFLTITPPIIKRPFTDWEMGRSPAFYPLVGLLLGGLLSGLGAGLQLILPLELAALLLLAAWVVLTGALHLDGFLDACDGLLGGWSPERRLEIMRDEHHGAYALAGGVLLLMLKAGALVSLRLAPAALITAMVLGRLGMTIALAWFPYCRPEGVGGTIKRNFARSNLLLAVLVSLGAAWLAAAWLGWLSLAVVVLVVWGGAQLVLRLIPGLTGDIYGALNEISESVILLIFVIGGGV